MRKSAQGETTIQPEKLPEEKLPQSELSELLDDKGVMKWLKIKRTQLYELMRQADNPLPHVRLRNRSLRFRPCAIAKWLERQEDLTMGRSSGGEKADEQGTIRTIGRKKTR